MAGLVETVRQPPPQPDAAGITGIADRRLDLGPWGRRLLDGGRAVPGVPADGVRCDSGTPARPRRDAARTAFEIAADGIWQADRAGTVCAVSSAL